METFFAVCQPGLEPWVAEELQRCLSPQEDERSTSSIPSEGDIDEGGVEFTGAWSALYQANLWLRTAHRILVRVGHFRASNFDELRRRACTLNWRNYLRPGQKVIVRATCHKSKLYHAGAIAERVVAAISERLGGEPVVQITAEQNSEGEPAQLILVRVANDRCTISLDSSGTLLHKRGYRQAIAKAPLRETLAATLLYASGWDRQSPLLDPFCGSGTIPIEAAMMAMNIAPGINREFAFMRWPGYDEVMWNILKTAAREQQHTSCPPLFGSDRDAGAVRMAQQNAERAGVAQYIQFRHCAVSSIEPPSGPGWIVTNPPYGVRISGKQDVRNLYAQFGKVLRALCPGWQVNVLSNDLALLGQMKIKLDTSLGMNNGGIPVRFGRGVVPRD